MNRRVVVIAEHGRGALADVTFELLAAGRRIARPGEDRLEVLLFGDGVEPLASSLGAADEVVLLEQAGWDFPFTSESVPALGTALRERSADVVLVAGTNVSMGLGTDLAAFLGAAYVNFCTDIASHHDTLHFTSRLLGGKILAQTRLDAPIGIVSVCPGSFPADEGRKDGPPPIACVTPALEAHKIKFVGFLEPEPGDVDIAKQDVLVSVGRGIQSKDNLELAEELARALGGAVSASRPVIDQGWLPLTRQVGKSGMSVKPQLYLALGISGAPEHYEGMKGSKLIVAVNTDPQAPIFDVARYGVRADLFDIVPALTEAVRARKSRV